MTNPELERINHYVRRIRNSDIDQYIRDNFPDTTLKNVIFGDYNALEFKKIYESVINRFIALMQSNIVLMLPSSYFSNGSGNNIIRSIKGFSTLYIR